MLRKELFGEKNAIWYSGKGMGGKEHVLLVNNGELTSRERGVDKHQGI